MMINVRQRLLSCLSNRYNLFFENVGRVLAEIPQVLQDIIEGFILVGYDTFDPTFEIGEQGEPYFCTVRVSLHQRLVVGQGVIVEEEPAGYVKSYEDIDGVMLVGSQDEEDSEHVQHPGYRMDVVDWSGGIWKQCW